jgi:hypothetical protein
VDIKRRIVSIFVKIPILWTKIDEYLNAKMYKRLFLVKNDIFRGLLIER